MGDRRRLGAFVLAVSLLVACGNEGTTPSTITATSTHTNTDSYTTRDTVPAPGGSASRVRPSPGPDPTGPDTTSAPTGPELAPDHGEDGEPYAGPPPSAARRPPEADPVEAVALRFLRTWWAAGDGTTWGQLADALAPVATDGFLAPYRQPSRADQPVAAGPPITPGAVTFTGLQGTRASASARGDRSDGGVVWRTVALVRAGDRSWKVDALR